MFMKELFQQDWWDHWSSEGTEFFCYLLQEQQLLLSLPVEESLHSFDPQLSRTACGRVCICIHV